MSVNDMSFRDAVSPRINVQKSVEMTLEKNPQLLDTGFNDTAAEWFSTKQGKKLLDESSGVPEGRTVAPPLYQDYINYEHRIDDDVNTVRIGDCQMVIPPDFISIKEIRNTEQVVSLRQESTLKDQHGYSRKEITMTVFFNGKDQINGYRVPSPFSYPYYVDGIRPLLAQFKCTPFLPITNQFLNDTNDIWNIALQSITVNTVQGFPDVLQATIIAHEFNAEPYIEASNYLLHDSIDWDLFRYYYQQLLKDFDSRSNIRERILKKSSTSGRLSEDFTISILDIEKLIGEDFNEKVDITDDLFLKMITNRGEYKDDFVVTDISFGLSNMLTFLQLSAHDSPTMQYIGGSDTMITINIETTSEEAVKAFRELSQESKKVTLSSRQQEGFGVLKVENDVLNIIGGQYLMVDNCAVSTSPDFPGKYNIYMECISYDMRTRSREDLEGFRPFKGETEGRKSDAISKSPSGTANKIRQDLEAERKIQQIEAYPDLFLPLYSEVDDALEKIRAFRTKNKLDPSAFPGKYPRRTSVHSVMGSNIYEKYVDPDFYINYPFDYGSMEDVLDMIPMAKPTPDSVDVEINYEIMQAQRQPQTFEDNPGYQGEYVDSTDYSRLSFGRQQYLRILLKEVGRGYVYGAIGQRLDQRLLKIFKRDYPRINRNIDKWLGHIVYDCSGFVAWGMWKIGLTDRAIRTTAAVLSTSTYSTKITKDQLIPGDLLYRSGHIAVYIGDGKTVEAANVDDGVKISVVGNRFTDYRRIKGIDSVRPVESDGSYGSTTSQRQSSATTSTAMTSSGNVIMSDGGSRVTVGKIGKFNSDKLDQYDSLILQYAQKYSLDPNWMKALMRQESTMRHDVVNHIPAVGLMQITKWVFQEFGYTFNIEKAKDPEFNIDLGFRYAKKCLDMFDGNYEHMVQAYNMGPYGFKQYLRREKGLPAETKNHVIKIRGFYDQLRQNIGETPMYNYGTSDGIYASENIVNFPVRKKHGDRGYEFTGEFGEPLFFESPVNKLVDDVIEPFVIDTVGSSTNLAYMIADEMFKNENYRKRLKAEWLSYYDNDYAKNIYNAQTEEKARDLIEDALTDPALQDMIHKMRLILQEFQPEAQPAEEKQKQELSDLTYKQQVRLAEDTKNEHVISRMTVDMKAYGRKRTMLRAFPTYVFAIVDESSDWMDGKKLWNNYYTYRSVVDIQVHEEKEQPVRTAIMTVTNMNNRLEKTPKEEFFKKGIEDDMEYSSFTRWLFRNTGIFIGGLKVTNQAVEEKNKLIKSVKLEPGARIHIRMGYGSNPSDIPVVFNGTVTDMSVGNMIRMVAQSDGIELINSIITSKKDETNSMSLLQREGSDIVASLLIDRENMFANAVNSNWGEKNRYGIEHFGNSMVEGLAVLDARKREYDLCKNIYQANYRQDLFCSAKGGYTPADGEGNIRMFLYNKTPWDIMQVTTQTLPEFVCQPMYHQFESRIFFGVPTWSMKYRYDVEESSGKIFEYAKTFSQFHMIDSIGDIIDNKVRCTDKKLFTNVIAMYSVAGDYRSTPVLYANKDIEWGKQKTKVVDTTIMQDWLGPDDLMMTLVSIFDVEGGKEGAIRVGLSNLIDSFERMYDDEIIIIGNTSIKPLDYIMIDDMYAEMSGLATVRSVTHSFSMNTGLTTSIVPGLITYSRMKDAGTSNVTNSLLSLGASIRISKLSRMMVIKTTNKITVLYTAAKQLKLYGDIKTLLQNVKTAKIVKSAADLSISVGQSIIAAATAGKNGMRIVRVTSFLSKLAPLKTFLVTNGPGIAIYIGTSILLNKIMESVTDYFAYNSCIGIKPLTHRGKHFVTNVTGQKGLIDGSNDGSSESLLKTEEE